MPESDAKYCVVLTTTDSEQSVKAIIDIVLARKLAACVQVMPIDSHYWWDGAVKNDKELLLILKAKAADYGELEAAIRSVHHYETPEVISLAVESGSRGYLDWIAAVTR